MSVQVKQYKIRLLFVVIEFLGIETHTIILDSMGEYAKHT